MLTLVRLILARIFVFQEDDFLLEEAIEVPELDKSEFDKNPVKIGDILEDVKKIDVSTAEQDSLSGTLTSSYSYWGNVSITFDIYN